MNTIFVILGNNLISSHLFSSSLIEEAITGKTHESLSILNDLTEALSNILPNNIISGKAS